MDPCYGFFPSLIHQVNEKERKKKVEQLEVSRHLTTCISIALYYHQAGGDRGLKTQAEDYSVLHQYSVSSNLHFTKLKRREHLDHSHQFQVTPCSTVPCTLLSFESLKKKINQTNKKPSRLNMNTLT